MSKPEEPGQKSGTEVSTPQRPRAVTVYAPRLPYDDRFNKYFGIDQPTFKVLCESLFPLARSTDAIFLAVSYCKAKGYDIMKKPVHIVPMWNADLGREVETVWTSITEHRIIAHRTGEYDGCDPTAFGPTLTEHFEAKIKKGRNTGKIVAADVTFPEWAQVTVYRKKKGEPRVAYPGPRTYYKEFFGQTAGLDVPNSRWARAPSQMLEKCAEAAALRKAFTEVGGEPTAEEMANRTIHQAVPTGTSPARPAAKPADPAKPGASATEVIIDEAEHVVPSGPTGAEPEDIIDGEVLEREEAEAAANQAQAGDGAAKEETKVRDRTAEYLEERIAEVPNRDESVLVQMDENIRQLLTQEGRDELLKRWTVVFDNRIAELKKAAKPKEKAADKPKADAPPIDPREQEYLDHKKGLYDELAKIADAKDIDVLESRAQKDLREEDFVAFGKACGAKWKELKQPTKKG